MTAYNNIISIMGTIFSLTLVSTCDHIVLQIREEKEIRQCLNEAHARLEMGKIYANGCLHWLYTLHPLLMPPWPNLGVCSQNNVHI